MSDKGGPSPFGDFDAKMRRLRKAPDDKKAQSDRDDRASMNFGDGLQVGIELVAGVGVGCIIGYALDVWFGTGPLLLVVFFFLGAAAGMLNAWRHLRRYTRAEGEE